MNRDPHTILGEHYGKSLTLDRYCSENAAMGGFLCDECIGTVLDAATFQGASQRLIDAITETRAAETALHRNNDTSTERSHEHPRGEVPRDAHQEV
jgi:hypothetical protein